jgi:hypothetical protein
MKDTDVTKLRRARSRAHFALKRAETLVQDYRVKLVDLEARIQAIAPELQLPARPRKPNPIFKRGELARLALTMLRTSDRPLAIREMALGAVAAKRIRFPDRRTIGQTHVGLREVFAKLQDRAVARTVGTGKATRLALVTDFDRVAPIGDRISAVAPGGAAGDARFPQPSPATAGGALIDRRESTYNGFVPDRLPVSPLAAVQFIAYSADYAAMGDTASTADILDALDRLAARYAALAAQREIKETQATRQ